MAKRAPKDDLADLRRGPIDEAAKTRIRAALHNSPPSTLARAAHIIRDQRLDGFGRDLVHVFETLKADPGCIARLAIIEALDFTDHPDAAVFLAASRWVQREPTWGGTVDAAGPLRARAILALSNLGYHDILLVAGEALADSEAPVRQAAAEALAHCGAREGAALLILAAQREKEPNVLLACLCGMLTLAADYTLPRFRLQLHERDKEARELAAIALGQSGRADALELLLEFLAESPIASERAVVLNALGLHRSERALTTLLDVIADGTRPDAIAAVGALRIQRFDARVCQRLREVAERRGDAVIRDAVEDALDEK